MLKRITKTLFAIADLSASIFLVGMLAGLIWASLDSGLEQLRAHPDWSLLAGLALLACLGLILLIRRRASLGFTILVVTCAIYLLLKPQYIAVIVIAIVLGILVAPWLLAYIDFQHSKRASS